MKTRQMYHLANAINKMLIAAKEVRENWPDEQEFDEYPFKENFNDVIDKILNWRTEVDGFALEEQHIIALPVNTTLTAADQENLSYVVECFNRNKGGLSIRHKDRKDFNRLKELKLVCLKVTKANCSVHLHEQNYLLFVAREQGKQLAELRSANQDAALNRFYQLKSR